VSCPTESGGMTGTRRILAVDQPLRVALALA
jgi:hypothetical protein